MVGRALAADTDLSVPVPVRTSDGRLTTLVHSPALDRAQPAALFHWLPGPDVDAAVRPEHLVAVGERWPPCTVMPRVDTAGRRHPAAQRRRVHARHEPPRRRPSVAHTGAGVAARRGDRARAAPATRRPSPPPAPSAARRSAPREPEVVPRAVVGVRLRRLRDRRTGVRRGRVDVLPRPADDLEASLREGYARCGRCRSSPTTSSRR